MKQIIVIGGGAAGLMAAVIAGREGARVILLEKMNMVGKKMGITGKGRCNITNSADMAEFYKKIRLVMVSSCTVPMNALVMKIFWTYCIAGG